jgi:hydroxymethylglutaryl-CoA reductase
MSYRSISFRKRILEKLRKILTEDELSFLAQGGLNIELADQLRENVIGTTQIPLCIADGFKINGKELLIPLATEERSIILQAERGAELVNEGFHAESSEQIMIGQIQVVNIPNLDLAEKRIFSEKTNLLDDARVISSIRKPLDLTVRRIETLVGPMLIVELYVDVKDSMGANLVDSMCELIAPTIEAITGGRVNMRILSNLATSRMVHVTAKVKKDTLGETIIDRVVKASAFASVDPYRATTHNKGVMNGVSAVLLATGNDTRAVEAGAHAYAALSGVYRPLTVWNMDKSGDLIGSLNMPMSVGTVGGIINAHPVAKLSLRILGTKNASELGQAVASTGLASNLGALYILVTSGIKSIQP